MDRLTIPEAARRLGITDAAVRKRYERGTIKGEKGDDNRIYVFVDAGGTERPSEASIVEILRDEIGHLRRESERKDAIIMSLSQANAEQARTIRALEPASDVSNPADYLEHEEALREEANLGTRSDEQRQRWHVHRHGASPGEPESPETVEEAPEGAEPRPDAPGRQEGAQRPWWRRVFGG